MSLDEGEFGRYRIVGKIGQGGMGQVFRAFDTHTNREVALKVLPAGLADDDDFRVRFQREADLVARIREPHVVPIHGFGEIDDRLYIDMRLVDGVDARTILKSDGPLAPERALLIVDQVAAALDAAHELGLEHRDVKPENILVAKRDFVYLIDFGIARALADTGLTRTGLAVGTFAYMAPERFSGSSDYRADIYSLACVLYELLTAAAPFPGSSVEQLIAGHLHLPPPSPSEYRELPRAIDDVIARGMAKAPEQRFHTAGELASAARRALNSDADHEASTGGAPVTVLAGSGPGSPELLRDEDAAAGNGMAAQLTKTRSARMGRRVAAGLVALVVAIAVAVLVGVLVLQSDETGTPSSTQSDVAAAGDSRGTARQLPSAGIQAKGVEVVGFTQIGTNVSIRVRNPNTDVGLIRSPFEATLLGPSGEVIAIEGQGGLPGAIINTIYNLPPGGEYGMDVSGIPNGSKVSSVELVTTGAWHDWAAVQPPAVTVARSMIADQSASYGPSVTGRITLEDGGPSNVVVIAFVRTPKGSVVSTVVVDCVRAAQPRGFQASTFAEVGGPFEVEKVVAYPTSVDGVEPSYQPSC